MHQLEIKVLDIVDARCNHEVFLTFQYCHNFCQFSHDQIAKHMPEKLKICTTVLYITLIHNTTTAVSLNKSQNAMDNLKQKDTQLKNLI